ncbi:MAG: hypothetical protein M1835_003064 [Candelina submexicana]|nr:MAG: hypothetical protein M1835_003064 [Candelina submexicana]
MANKEESVFEVTSETPCEETPAPACSDGPACYDERTCCEEVPSDSLCDPPCEETPAPACSDGPACYEEPTSCDETPCEEVAKISMEAQPFPAKAEALPLEEPAKVISVGTKKAKKAKKGLSKKSRTIHFQDAAEPVPEHIVQPKTKLELTSDLESLLELDVKENNLCAFRAKHLLEGDIWKHCQKCRAVIRQVSLQLARDRGSDKEEYEIVDRILAG